MSRYTPLQAEAFERVLEAMRASGTRITKTLRDLAKDPVTSRLPGGCPEDHPALLRLLRSPAWTAWLEDHEAIRSMVQRVDVRDETVGAAARRAGKRDAEGEAGTQQEWLQDAEEQGIDPDEPLFLGDE